jgi:hypothetical protein
MLASGSDGSNTEDIALQEAEQVIKDMFVLGKYKLVAEKNHINPDDIKKILPQVYLLMNRESISFTIALIMKPEDGFRDVYIVHAGMGKCYKINSNEVKSLSPEERDKKEIIVEKLKKEDAFLLCSCDVAESLDNKFVQQAISLFREPEELCKRIIFASYNKTGLGNYSVAVFIERNKTIKERKKKRVTRFAVLSGIILVLVASWIVINNFAFKTIEPLDIINKKDNSTLVDTPPVIINQTPHKVLVPDLPKISVKDFRTEQVKKTTNTRNVDFMINGSVMMITNWSKDIRYINWEPNQRSKKRIHKYSDYTQMPGSVMVTFKDNSTRVFKIKNK